MWDRRTRVMEYGWSVVEKEWVVRFVDDIHERSNPSLRIFSSLPHSDIYSLHIDYNIEGLRPHEAYGLNREQLRNEIAGHFVAPSSQLTNIYISQCEGDAD